MIGEWLTWMYSCANVIYQPFENPINSLPMYNPAMFVVVIITILLMQHSALASHKHCRRPNFVAKTPANDELKNAPKVIKEEMSCCRSVDML